MIKYIVKRLLMLVPVLLGVAFVIFTMLFFTPGDPAISALGTMASPEALAEFRVKQGLDDPFLIQFKRYVVNVLVNGDMGTSYITKRPVMNEILSVFPNTLKVTSVSVVLCVLLGIPLGILSAIKQNSWMDTSAMLVAFIGLSMPVFWLGLLLILFFSVYLGWLPSSGLEGPLHYILPSITMGTFSLAVFTRMTRSSMLEVIRQDFIRTARAKGQKESTVIWTHALRNALIPVITVVGRQFGVLLAGAVLTESIFSIPGVGRLMVESIKMRDYPVVQGAVLFIAVAFCIVNLIVDLLYGFVDPRIRARYK
jgi:peptide/nickel transport system permease protein